MEEAENLTRKHIVNPECWRKQESREKIVQSRKERGKTAGFSLPPASVSQRLNPAKSHWSGTLENRAELGRAGINLRQRGPGAVWDTNNPLLLYWENFSPFLGMSPAGLGGAPWALLTRLHVCPRLWKPGTGAASTGGKQGRRKQPNGQTHDLGWTAQSGNSWKKAWLVGLGRSRTGYLLTMHPRNAGWGFLILVILK